MNEKGRCQAASPQSKINRPEDTTLVGGRGES